MKQLLTSPQVSIISPGATLDNYNAGEMVDALMSARTAGVRFVIIDLAQTEFISSAGVGSILGTVNGFKEAGGDLILCNVADSVMQVLRTLDLDSFFTVRRSRSDALALTEAHV